MKFILWRHAEAEVGTGDDLARQLTIKGRQQAQVAAEKIQAILPKNALIHTSQAIRSQQTAAYLTREPLVQAELNPDVVARDLPTILQRHQDDDCVVWVGHQPWIGDLAAYLLTGQWTNVWIKKGAFWQFDLRWQGENYMVKLRSVVSG